MSNSIVCVICHASGYTCCAHRPYYEATKSPVVGPSEQRTQKPKASNRIAAGLWDAIAGRGKTTRYVVHDGEVGEVAEQPDKHSWKLLPIDQSGEGLMMKVKDTSMINAVAQRLRKGFGPLSAGVEVFIPLAEAVIGVVREYDNNSNICTCRDVKGRTWTHDCDVHKITEQSGDQSCYLRPISISLEECAIAAFEVHERTLHPGVPPCDIWFKTAEAVLKAARVKYGK